MKYSEWLACWLKNFAAPKLKCVTTDKYARICKNHIATKLGERELSELDAVVLQNLSRDFRKGLLQIRCAESYRC